MRAVASLALSAVLCLPCFAWNDDEDSFGKVNPTRRSSVIDYGYDKKPDDSFANQQRNSVKLGSIQEGNERLRRQMDNLAEQNRRAAEELDRNREKFRKEQEARNNKWEAQRWRDVETVAGAFVASGPYYEGGQANVITDKGLVYSTGRGSVVAPDGYYYRSGNLWVGPNGKLAGQTGSGNNSYIWGSDDGTAIGAGRGYFTERGYSWPAYPDQSSYGVSRTMRKP